MPHKLQVLVAGGGIGGLTCAVSLRRAGHSVTVLEKASLSHEVGQGITCAPNGVRVLDRLGLDVSKPLPLAEYTGACVVKADDLEVISQQIFADLDQRYGFMMKTAYRPDLHAALVELATGVGEGEAVTIKTKTAVADWNAEEGSLVLEDGTVLTADLIIAADGVKSHAAKHVLEPDIPCPTIDSSSTIVYRFTLPTAKVKADPEISHLLDAGNGMCTFNVLSPKMDRWLVRYYCHNNEICNFALYALDKPPDADGQEHELRFKTDRNSLVKAMEGFHPSLLKVASMADDVLPLWRCTTREPLARLHRGRMVVIGDAAHPVLPHIGLGAVSAIEDAGALGVLFSNLPADQTQDTGRLVSERFELFSRMRVPRVAAYKFYSDTPFFRDAATEQGDRVKEWYKGDDLPRNAQEVRTFYMKYDVIKDAEMRLAEAGFSQ
ncbi:hypothetical protein PRZ48_003002 [Zasmidium cellare]|uniref:FAD-binding domain-containing protein n=1 Tax=Zasmidium cellare TaxID=395010 RepID=A0ABR0ETU4_ZASCE|nr:hypothetical protein PRZ48_003002 [Zasmidium cellare]